MCKSVFPIDSQRASVPWCLGAMDNLPRDALLSVALSMRNSPISLLRFARTCRAARDVVCEVTHAVRIPHAPRSMNQGEICDALFLSPAEAQQLPFRIERKRRFHGGTYDTHWFDMCSAIPVLLRLFGGWAALKRRLDERASRKRKREELEARREEASAKRRATLDDWISKDLPFGEEVDSVDSWEESLRRRGFVLPSTNSILNRFLGASALTGPAVETAKQAALDFEATQKAAARRKAEVLEVVRARGYEMDESLHISKVFNSFEYVGTIWGFNTAPATLGIDKATAMAERIIEEIEEKARAEDRAMAVVFHGARKCTAPGCPNTHRVTGPAIGPNGPICRRCERV